MLGLGIREAHRKPKLVAMISYCQHLAHVCLVSSTHHIPLHQTTHFHHCHQTQSKLTSKASQSDSGRQHPIKVCCSRTLFAAIRFVSLDIFHRPRGYQHRAYQCHQPARILFFPKLLPVANTVRFYNCRARLDSGTERLTWQTL